MRPATGMGIVPTKTACKGTAVSVTFCGTGVWCVCLFPLLCTAIVGLMLSLWVVRCVGSSRGNRLFSLDSSRWSAGVFP